MTQTEFALVEAPRIGTQHHTLLLAFRRGESLTVAEALTQYGVYALSQRVGELKKMGWPIISEPYVTANGARIARYSMAKAA